MTDADSIKSKPKHVGQSELIEFCKALLTASGASLESADIVARHLVEAETLGLKSHGIIRVPQYLGDIETGSTDPSAKPTFINSATGRSFCDGGKGFGQVAGIAMAEKAVALAKENGISFVTGRNMGHTGRIGAFPEVISAAGMVGIAVCSGPKAGHWVAPYGGRDGRIATNPIAYALPVKGNQPIVADFSTSAVPEGAVRSLMNRGLPVPEGALRDADGQFTTDPSSLYEHPRGAIQPLGGDFGYRGTALGIFVDVLAALLANDDVDDATREGSNMAIMAIATDNDFSTRALQMSSYIKSSTPLDVNNPVLLPGDRERQTSTAIADGPLFVDAPTWMALLDSAKTLNISPPETVAE